MLKYIFGRIISLLMILLAVSVIVFTLMHSVPGGPFDERKGRLPPAAKANILKKYGLDQPVWKQYLNYMSLVSISVSLFSVLIQPLQN